ncbi:MAG TPA: hypothetical protein VFX30_08920 [bacterium]|nr:hypothetical protein [bacterium]
MKEILEKIAAKPSLEARWLNTLSLLEYIGARKIGKTFSKVHPSIEVLEHHADETRHAFAFKRLSAIVSGGEDLGYLCPDEAIDYFQTLDKTLSDWITKLTSHSDSNQNYLIVTAVIERRAMKLYPVYRRITRNGFIRDELKRVVEEEASHRRLIEEGCLKIMNRNDVPDFEECDRMEEELFSKFQAAVEKALA